MDKNPLVNIYKMIRELKIVPHKKRQEFLVEMVGGIIKSRSVLFSEIAGSIDKPIERSSIERRIQDFFKEVSIDYQQLMRFFLSFVHHDKLTLSIDRTEWDFGKTQINILCAVVSIGKMAVPIYFEMLDNKSGNSNWKDRISLLKGIIEVIGLSRIDMLIMDREFIGENWLKWLRETGIPFCVRVPKHHQITLGDGTKIKAVEALKGKKTAYFSDVFVDNTRVNVSLSFDDNCDLLYLVGTVKKTKLKAIYRRRWSIEVFFQALKSRGFNLEKSCLRDLQKYKKLFAIVSMAYTLSWATGIQSGKIKPVKVKKHGYPQFSVFRRGLNLLRDFFKKHKKRLRENVNIFNQTLTNAFDRLLLNFKIIG
jgi:hypothetical protein